MDRDITCRLVASGWDELQNVKHSHNAHEEILFVERGKGVFIIDDKMFPLTDGCLFFIGKNTLHYSAPMKHEDYVRSVVTIRSAFWETVGELCGYGDVFAELASVGCIALDPMAAKRVGELLEALAGVQRRDSVRALLALLDIAEGQGVRMDRSDHKAAAIMAYISHHLTEPLRLEDIASALFINKYYMCHIFKDTTGMSISQYILLQRLSLCKKMLISTDRSISDISEACGFSCFSYFCRIFQRTEGMSARDYRSRFAPKIVAPDRR